MADIAQTKLISRRSLIKGVIASGVDVALQAGPDR